MSTSPISTPTAAAGTSRPSAGRRMLSKVPEITVLFWIVLTTGMGESGSDWLLNRG